MGHYEQAYENDAIKLAIKQNTARNNDVDNLQKLLRSVPKGCIITRMKIREAIFWRDEEKHEF